MYINLCSMRDYLDLKEIKETLYTLMLDFRYVLLFFKNMKTKD